MPPKINPSDGPSAKTVVVKESLTPACGAKVGNGVPCSTGVKLVPMPNLSTRLPALLFRLTARFGEGDGGPIDLPCGIPQSAGSVLRLRRLGKDGRRGRTVRDRPRLASSRIFWRALAASGPKFARSRKTLIALSRAISIATEFLMRGILGQVARSPLIMASTMKSGEGFDIM